MRVLVDKVAIERAQKAFECAISSAADAEIATVIGHPSGRRHATVYWVSSANLWAYFGFPQFGKSPGMRYWNVFGLEKPAASVSIVCEINSPISGIYRRPVGAFAESHGSLYVLHRGTLNAFRGRIPHDFVRTNFNGNWLTVDDGDRMSSLLKVGQLSNRNFINDLRDFVAECGRMKDLYKKNMRAAKSQQNN